MRRKLRPPTAIKASAARTMAWILAVGSNSMPLALKRTAMCLGRRDEKRRPIDSLDKRCSRSRRRFPKFPLLAEELHLMFVVTMSAQNRLHADCEPRAQTRYRSRSHTDTELKKPRVFRPITSSSLPFATGLPMSELCARTSIACKISIMRAAPSAPLCLA